jgi:hypothetical protein
VPFFLTRMMQLCFSPQYMYCTLRALISITSSYSRTVRTLLIVLVSPVHVLYFAVLRMLYCACCTACTAHQVQPHPARSLQLRNCPLVHALDSSPLHSTPLYSTVLQCLHCTVLWCSTLHYSVSIALLAFPHLIQSHSSRPQ